MKILVYDLDCMVNFCGNRTHAFGEDYKLLRLDSVPLCYYNIKLDEYFVLFDFLGDSRSGTLCVGGELDFKHVDFNLPRIIAPAPAYKKQEYNQKSFIHGNIVYYLYILDGLTSEQIVTSLVENYLEK